MPRAVVRVEAHPMAGEPGADRTRFVAVCATGDCSWRSTYHVVKAGASDEARWHRATHQTKDS